MDSGSAGITASSSMRNLKSRKSNQGEDIISNLPEPIITHILSCLPIRDAVRTSVLSRTWKCNWKRVTKMELDDGVFYSGNAKTGIQRFIEFVNGALHASNLNMESFHLVLNHSSNGQYEPSLVKSWIATILERGVKKLYISSCLRFDFSSALPSHPPFNSSYYLEELELNMNGCLIRVPLSFVYFRHLKFLELCEVTLTLDSPSDPKDVTLDFPALKEFNIIDCNWLGIKSVTLKMPLLERIFIGNVDSYNDSPYGESSNCAIKICALRITEFTCVDYISQDISLVDPSSVKGAFASIRICDSEPTVQEAGRHACELLKQFSQVQRLELDISVLHESKVSLTVLPQFEILTHLELELVCGENLLALLHKSPFLKTLKLELLRQCDEEILNSVAVPNCLLSTLEVVKLQLICYGYQPELCFAKFVMENALELKRMSFSLSRWESKSKSIEKFKKKLFSSKKDFNLAIIDFRVYDE